MRIFTLLFLFLAGVLTLQVSPNMVSTVQASGTRFCVSNEEEYLAKKNAFPEVARGIEADKNGKMFKITDFKSNFAKAAINLRIARDKKGARKLVADVSVNAPGTYMVLDEKESNYISQLCFDGQVLDIQVENGSKYSAKVVSPTTFEVLGANFVVTDKSTYDREVNAVRNPKKSSPPDNNSGAQ